MPDTGVMRLAGICSVASTPPSSAAQHSPANTFQAVALELLAILRKASLAGVNPPEAADEVVHRTSIFSKHLDESIERFGVGNAEISAAQPCTGNVEQCIPISSCSSVRVSQWLLHPISRPPSVCQRVRRPRGILVGYIGVRVGLSQP
jgi:hypothetical protein